MTTASAPARGPSAAVRPALLGNVKATREDWLGLALSVLARRGAAAVTVLDLSERLKVSRSSFYWYFRNRDELLDALLQRWESLNTRSIVRQSEAPAGSINEAVCNVFRCWVDPELFSPRLDFAVREWARRSDKVRAALDRSDGERTAAIRAMFERRGYPFEDALVRARVLYFMQIGYYALDIKESMEARLKLTPHYLETFSGVAPREEDLASFRAYAMRHAGAPDLATIEGDR
ncbi:MAG TPA: TetR/AcrR family transcriptional regulator [Roseiarcus sp.]|nr:TetR/AcrR family transcriptional regulator [Roseiarcus sp.]